MGFLKKLFGGKKEGGNEVEDLVRDTTEQIIEKAGFDLDYDVNVEKDDRFC